ncbi:MAG: DUF3656 domain-containing U32 family peptidase [Candidatus Latescibacterota bacterium]
MKQKPEIMSPAGYWPQLRAAVEAGADAVYLGLDQFSARAKVGFTQEELPEAMAWLRERGVKGYVTFNTLVYDEELDRAAQMLADLADIGPDALIVQDLGIARLAREVAPELEIHGSTQMSIANAEGVRLAQRFGVRRVVLARELSLHEIRALQSDSDCELEVFVHGALCVSYSGQCFSSEAWGGRSANRGQCAQACRLPYDLLVDEEIRPLDDARYLLSPGDLYALHEVRSLVEIGISALKIEGRYKEADYVALTTRAYRAAVDAAWDGGPLQIEARDELDLEQVYSRGLGPHFLQGTNHQTVVRGRAPRHRGVRVGSVRAVRDESVLVESDPAAAAAPLKAGDGVVFDAADWRDPALPEEGGHVYHVLPVGEGTVEVSFANGAIDFARIRPGDWLWRTRDPQLEKRVRPYVQANTPLRKQALAVRAIARVGQPLRAEWTLADDASISVEVCSSQPLSVAQNRALDVDYLRAQWNRLGHTPYVLDVLELDTDEDVFMPVSALGALRQEAVEALRALQKRPKRQPANDPQAALGALRSAPETPPHSARPQLHLLVRTPEQLEAALSLRPASVTLDYLDLYDLRPAVDAVRAQSVFLRVASPRIVKQGEEAIARFLCNLQAPILVRGGGLLESLVQREHPPLTGDFSLNAANEISANELLKLGLERLTPTHDLNGAQVAALAERVGPQKIEVVAYGHLPVFHTEHCVFCRFLSEGTSKRDCGKPCTEHRVALRDREGRAHPVLADVGCRNTVFGAEAQEASAHMARWLSCGITHWRLEFAHECGDQVVEVGRLFERALRGDLAPRALGNALRMQAPEGTTEGSLFIPDLTID